MLDTILATAALAAALFTPAESRAADMPAQDFQVGKRYIVNCKSASFQAVTIKAVGEYTITYGDRVMLKSSDEALEKSAKDTSNAAVRTDVVMLHNNDVMNYVNGSKAYRASQEIELPDVNMICPKAILSGVPISN